MLNIKFNRKLKLILCTCLMSYIQLIVGASLVFSAILLTILKEPTSPIKVNSEDASWIASVPLLVCPIGLFIIGILTDKIGSRRALQIAYLPLILSWVVLANANSLKAIIIGRIISGTTMGSSTCTYLFLGEVCPTEYRPLSFSVVMVFTGVGMIIQFTLALFFHWRTMSAIMAVVSVVGCVSLFTVPESPVWLRSHDRIREAEAAEKWLGMEAPAAAAAATGIDGGGGGGDHNRVRGTTLADGLAAVPYWKLFRGPTVWKPMLITVSFFACQQLSGFYVMLFYSVDVLRDCKVPCDGITVSIFLSASRIVGSLAFSAFHQAKRRTLMCTSSVGAAMSLIAIVVYVRVYHDIQQPPYGALLIFAFVLYLFFAMLAILPLPWALCGEVFPMAIKGTMTGIVQIIGYELMFVVIKLYPAMVDKFGIENVWSLFAGFCIISAFFGKFIMPETKGKSLNEILSSFE